MTDNTFKRDEEPVTEGATMDPAQCPYRETCPHLMQCVNEFLLDMARQDWGLHEDKEKGNGQG